jgi:hypothetical protein
LEKTELLGMLDRARSAGNIYLIARSALMLLGQYGENNFLSKYEKEQILEKYVAARNKKGMLGLEPGYELARWIMLCHYLLPDENVWPSRDDIALIREASDQYCRDRNLRQIASLVQTCSIFNVSLNLRLLPLKKRRKIIRLAARLR